MSAKDIFHVYLRSLPTRPIEFRVSGDGNALLHITADVVLYVRPAEDDLPAVIAGLVEAGGGGRGDG